MLGTAAEKRLELETVSRLPCIVYLFLSQNYLYKMNRSSVTTFASVKNLIPVSRNSISQALLCFVQTSQSWLFPEDQKNK